MKKSIGIITYSNSEVAKHIRENLMMILGDEVIINNYFLKALDKNQVIEDDIVVVMIKEMGIDIVNQLKNKNALVTLQRTVQEKYLYEVFAIPEEMEVLVVNDTYETTLETIALLYQIGIKTIKFVPFKEGVDYSHMKIAITPDETTFVPKYIEKVINIGQRVIDLSSFIQIIGRLDMTDQAISRRLLEYSKEIVSLSMGVNKTLQDLHSKNEEMKTLLNLSSDGILMTSADGRIIQYNEALEDILNLTESIESMTVEEVMGRQFINTFDEDEIDEKLYEIDQRNYLVNKRLIHYYGQNSGISYIFKDVTQVKELERTLNQQMCENGLVAKYTFDMIHTKSQPMIKMLDIAKRVSNTDMTIFIAGESGTGKEMLAQSIHNASARKNYPFVAVNCGALSESLLESELFGYEAGAFTGALKKGKMGLFEQAHKGTIFLDEIGDMPKTMQTRLLRVLQEEQVMRVGAKRVIDIDVRVIVATHKDLFEMVDSGHFRQDLYFRINVFPLEILPLRERQEDIIELFYVLMEKVIQFDDSVLEFLTKYYWSGNIRELKNVARYLKFLDKEIITKEDLPSYLLRQHQKRVSGSCISDSEGRVDPASGVGGQVMSNPIENSPIRKATDIQESSGNVHNNHSTPINTHLLKLLGCLKEENKAVGRNSLSELLKAKGVTMSPGEIRSQLEYMKANGLIESKSGRRGSVLNQAGYEFYKETFGL